MFLLTSTVKIYEEMFMIMVKRGKTISNYKSMYMTTHVNLN